MGPFNKTVMNLLKPLLNNIKLMLLTVLISAAPFLVHAQQGPLTELIDRARSAGIEQSQIDHLQRSAERSGISHSELMMIITPAVIMAENNLPWEMIFNKASEGMSKGIDHWQMELVLSSIAENAGRSAEFVDPWVQRSEVGRMLDRPGSGMDRNKFRNEMVKVGTKALTENFDGSVLEQTLNTIAEDGALENIRPSGVIAAINVLSETFRGNKKGGSLLDDRLFL